MALALAQLFDALFLPAAPNPSGAPTSATSHHSRTSSSNPASPPARGAGRDTTSGAGPFSSSAPQSPPAATGSYHHPSPPQQPAVAELPLDALEQVLLRCDVDTLVGKVPAVCRDWRDASRALSLWRRRLAPGLQTELAALATLGPPLSPPRLFLTLQGRNLLRNPTFRRDVNAQPQLGRVAAKSKWQRNAWVVTAPSTEDGVAWELPPAGIRMYGNATGAAVPPPPLPYPGSSSSGGSGGGGGSSTSVGRTAARVVQGLQLQSLFGNGSGGFGNGGGSGAEEHPQHQQGCLATANDWAEVVQVVDLHWELQRRGLSAAQAAHLLDAGLALRLSVHVGSRWDCVGQYSVGFILDEGSGNANGYGGGGGGAGAEDGDDCVPSLQSFVMRPTRHHFYTGRACCTSDSWQRFEYLVPACPRGFRRAVVMLRGRRAPNSIIVSPMPRYCGAKFSAAELVFA